METKVEYVYHWNRIIVALAFLLVFIGIFALLIFRWLSTAPESTKPIEAELSTQTTPAPDQHPSPPASPVVPPVATAIVEPSTAAQINKTTPSSGDQPEEAPPTGADEPIDAMQPEQISESLEEGGAGAESVRSEPRTSADVEKPGTPSTSVAVADPKQGSASNEVIAEITKEDLQEPLTPTAGVEAIKQGLRAPTAQDERVISEQPQASAPPSSKPHPEEIEPSLPPPKIAATDAVKEQPSTPVKPTSGPSQAAVERGLLPPPASGMESEQSPETDLSTGSDAPFQLGDINTHGATVTRFKLAKSVVKLEPRGELSDIIFDKRGMAAVYCFSEVIGREHPTIEYIWYRNDRAVARVNVAVKGKRWRSYSSKLINQSKQGNWRVELRGSNNELLASAEFSL